jgi:uncharacterized small protein (DUF1192 family)
MRATTVTPTRKLATARLEFSSDRRFKRALQLVAVTVLVLLSILIGWQLRASSDGSGADLARLRQQNAALQADVARARIELQLERSTRAALARQVAELNERTSALQSRLEFFNAQSGQPVAAR